MVSTPSSDLQIPFELWYQDIAPNYPTIRVSNAHASATIALHGAHIIDYIPTDHEPVLYTSPTSAFTEGKAIRGGVPLCWPWFNAHPTNPDLPSHGFARNRFWQLTDTASTPEYTELIFQLETSTITELTLACSASLTIRIGAELRISLTTTNESDEDITIGGALHSYFLISNIQHISISGLDQTPYLDTTNGTHHVQQGDLTIVSETDNIYTNTSATTIIQDAGLHREIHITKEGSRSTVIWNPWIEKAQALSDLPDEDYQHFICIEAANAQEDVRTLKPNQSHTLTTSIRSLTR